MPFLIVDLLEVVEVEDDERDPRRLVLRVAQHLLEVLVEGTLVGEARQRVAASLGVRQGKSPLVRKRRSGQVGDARNQFRVAECLDARRQCDEDGTQGLGVRDQRSRDRLRASRTQPVELTQLVRVRLDEAKLRVRARDDVRRRVQRLGRARPGQSGQGERAFRRREIGRRERRAREVGELTRDEVGRAAAVHRAGDRVREADERLARAGESTLELPERSALDAVRVGARLEHRHHVVGVVRARIGDDPSPREHVADALRRDDAVDDGHLHVHQDHVRVQGGGDRDCFLAVLGLAHDLDLRLLGEAGLDGLARVRRVVADQQTKHSTPSTEVGGIRTCRRYRQHSSDFEPLASSRIRRIWTAFSTRTSREPGYGRRERSPFRVT